MELRWVVWIYNYRQTTSTEKFNKLIGHIKEGKITVPLNSMMVLPGAAPAEATLRDNEMVFGKSIHDNQP